MRLRPSLSLSLSFVVHCRYGRRSLSTNARTRTIPKDRPTTRCRRTTVIISASQHCPRVHDDRASSDQMTKAKACGRC
eukprot:scaffold278242_cov20-Prasinocladus_malaysianus.AAC.2